MDVMGRIEIIWGMVVVFMVMKGRGEGRVQVGLSYEEGRVQVGLNFVFFGGVFLLVWFVAVGRIRDFVVVNLL